ncbi:MAG: DUF4199 domain-containing protein [Bacteroidetes bacterium]|nr:DUF4199 domain-containing protein [Bacteroidota bacterium]
MTRPSFKFGSISGIIMAVIFLIPFLFMRDSKNLYSYFQVGEIIGYSTMILCLLFVFFGIRSYRDTELGGMISFGRAFSAGLMITFVASLIFGIFTIILYKFISPNLGNEMIEFYKRSIMESGKPQEFINEQLTQMEAQRELFNNSLFQFFTMFSTVFIIGTIIAIISALILKKNNPKTQTA